MVNETWLDRESMARNNGGNPVLARLAWELTEWKNAIEFSYREIEWIIKDYYEKQWNKNVKVKITNTENKADWIHPEGIFTKIFVTMDVMVMWIKKTERIEISMDSVKEIMGFLLKKEWKNLITLEDNVHHKTRDVGYRLWEHKERYLTWKRFTIVFDNDK